jgi:hypothetical protein
MAIRVDSYGDKGVGLKKLAHLALTKNVLYLLSYVGLLHFIMEGVGFEPT